MPVSSHFTEKFEILQESRVVALVGASLMLCRLMRYDALVVGFEWKTARSSLSHKSVFREFDHQRFLRFASNFHQICTVRVGIYSNNFFL